MNVISLYWIAMQQQTSTFRQQTFDLFYPEFSAELNDLSLKVRGRGQKMSKTKTVRKNAFMCVSESKG